MSNRYPAGVVRKNQVVPAANGASGVWTIGQATQATKSDIWPYSNIAVPIQNSLRFRNSASAYLSRTVGSPTNANKWTWSGWVKRGTLGAQSGLFGAWRSSACVVQCYFQTNDTLRVYLSNGDNSTYLDYQTSQVFRDSSAWYHIVVSVDNTLSTTSVIIYVNGVQVTSYGTSSNTLTQNVGLPFNYSGTAIYIGQNRNTGNAAFGYFDGYMTDINFIDGQQLDASYFGSSNAVTGVWQPIPYSGTYGTNGFHLEFKDTTVGKDTSGNNNHWTPNNISTTLGSTYDLMTDVPTQWSPRNTTDVGGVVRGNYPVINPLDKGTNATVDNGNLRVYSSSGWTVNRATMAYPSTGKWYFEWIFTDNTPAAMTGIATAQAGSTSSGLGTDAYGWGYHYNGNKYNNNSAVSYGASYTTGDVIGVAFDSDTGTLTFYKNNSSQGTAYTGLTTSTYFPVSAVAGATAAQGPTINFGQQPFVYTPPSGYKALCITNLPTPTIGATVATAANKYFDATLYTGTGSSRSITGLNFAPDFVWMKSRSYAYGNALFDTIRGVTRSLQSQDTAGDETRANDLTAFNSDGFTVGSGTNVNQTSNTYISWAWNAGGSNTTNTSGTITSIVRANPTAGFSIVTWTGSGAAGTVGHGLGTTPAMIIIKNRTTSSTQWVTWHQSLSGATATDGAYIYLNSTAAASTTTVFYNGSQISSSVFGLRGNNSNVNASPDNYIAYCWAPIAGYSAFGTYTGNASTDGPFVYTGFRPRFILIRRTDAPGGWKIYNTSGLNYNPINTSLEAQDSAAEATSSSFNMDWLSNGFKIRTTYTDFNASGANYIYMAFAENPFKNSLAR